ncbi:MAG TPA: hypothetical protein VM223_25085 [Planctomycetota bacterium]|nr:hypothetical protein [Planctomycetota bacterium]
MKTDDTFRRDIERAKREYSDRTDRTASVTVIPPKRLFSKQSSN